MNAPAPERRRHDAGISPSHIRLATALARHERLSRALAQPPTSRRDMRAVENGSVNLEGIYQYDWQKPLGPQPWAWVNSGWFSGAVALATGLVLLGIAMGWIQP